MAYRDDISALGADHHWDFDGDSLDQIGSVNGTDTSILYTSSAIAEDATNCAETNAVTDRVSIPTTTEINNSAQARKAVCGWFTATAIQNPPKNIYGEGNATQAFRFILGWGNYLMFEVDNTSTIVQIFSDVPLAVDRPYHLCLIYENSTYGNEVRAYLDGVEQLSADPSNRQPGASTLPARTVAEFGDPAGTVAVGGTAVILIAPINGKWNHWATWGDEADAVLTDTEVREELFEKGALPFNTISAGTEAVMQAEITLDEDSSTGTDVPLDIRVEQVTGDGDLELTIDDRTFDPLASIHVQYMGTGTLTIINTGTSNASIGSTPNGGTIIFATEVTVQITCKDAVTGAVIEDARVYVLDSGDNVILNDLTNASGILSGTYNYTTDDTISSKSRARKGTASPYYKTAPIAGTITIDGLSLTILMISDE